MTPRTFLIFANDLPLKPSGIRPGGGEVATVNLAFALAELGHRVVLACVLEGAETTVNGVEFWDLGESYDVKSAVTRARELGEYHVVAATLSFGLFVAKHEPGVRSRIFIWHAATASFMGLSPRTASLAVDRLVCVSESQRRFMVESGSDPMRTVVVRNGVDRRIFNHDPAVPRDFNKLLFTGVLIYEKGIHVLLSAFAELKREFPSVTLDIVGRKGGWKTIDDQIDEIERSIPGVKFHGLKPHEEVAGFMRRAGLLIMPSLIPETAGLVLLEAQSCGCPVLCFDLGGMPEMMRDGVTGGVVKELSPEGLVKGIGALLRSPDKLAEYSRNAPEFAKQFSWERTASEIYALAESLARINRY